MYTSTAQVRVLLVARHPAVSTTVRAVLEREPRFALAETVTSAIDATRIARHIHPTLAICDTTLPDPGSIELARFFRLRLPSTSVVFVSPSPTEDELFEAVRVGVAAYLHTASDPRLLVAALRRTAEGEFLIDDEVIRRPSVASRILSHFRANPGSVSEAATQPAPRGGSRAGETSDRFAPLYVPLSGREIEVLDLVARGNSNKLIARQLGISDQTVKNHITTILRKLEVNDRTEAVVFALRNGWIRADAPTVTARR